MPLLGARCCRCPQTEKVINIKHIYEARPRKHKRGIDLSDALPFGRLWYTKPDDAIGYATFYSRSHAAVIRVYDAGGDVIEMHQHAGEFREW